MPVILRLRFAVFALILLAVFVAFELNAQTVAKSFLDIGFVKGKAFWKHPENSPFELNQGQLAFQPGMTVLTFFNGQCFFEVDDEIEVRMKEDSLVAIYQKNSLEVRKGLVGFRGSGKKLGISTPHASLLLETGTIVIKTNPVLTRITVVKGSVLLVDRNHAGRVRIDAGKEVAVGGGKYSKFYAQTAELRYAWYWVEPSKEPSLQP